VIPSKLVFATFFTQHDKKLPKQWVSSKSTKGNECFVSPLDKLEYA